MRPILRTWRFAVLFLGVVTLAAAAEPPTNAPPSADPAVWDVRDVKPGMKGFGRTVMVGTKLETFQAEVLGVLRDVSPGRDMILCRLSGCNLEHAGIIQGMSGSPVYIDGKLLGAVAYAWEFAKDPIAGVTPYSQMVEYVDPSRKRIAAELGQSPKTASLDGSEAWSLTREPSNAARPASAAGLGGMIRIGTPLGASGFSPRALAGLSREFEPIGLSPVAGGAAQADLIKQEGDKPLAPGSPLSIGLVIGDFDLSGIGTVTHVDGDRVYGFGHPMLGLGRCELPLMTGYIHTVYPRASVSMKMGSPLKMVGTIDADVSTGVSGRLGAVPDLLPMTVDVQMGRYSRPRTFQVRMVREPTLLPGLVTSTLTSSIDAEGNLPEEFTAELQATIALEDAPAIVIEDRLSGPRYSGPMGANALFSSVSNAVRLLVQNDVAPVRIRSITCKLNVSEGRQHAEIQSVRLASDRVQPGGTVRVLVGVKPFQSEAREVPVELSIPADFPEGSYELVVADLGTSINRRLRNDPTLRAPVDRAGVIRTLEAQGGLRRDRIYLHLPSNQAGVALASQPLPDLPASVRAAFSDNRQTPAETVRTDLIAEHESAWVIDGSKSLRVVVQREPVSSLLSTAASE